MKKQIQIFFTRYWIEIIILLFFATIYSSISLVNHYNFRTFAFDLGIYNNALYDYAHFRFNQTKVMAAVYNGNILGDHFELYLMLFSPFSYFFGSYTLLIFQILAILFGGIGIYCLMIHLAQKRWYALLSMFHFFSLWGIYSALSFDYHNNVVAAMLVPWLLYFFYTNKFKIAYLFLGLILIGKENMSLWIMFILIGLLVMFFKDVNKRKFIIISFAVSLLYFMVVVKFLIPYFTSPERDGYYYINQYALLGNSFTEIIQTIIFKPRYTFSLLFENTIPDNNYSGIKTEMFFVLLLSGGFALLYKPQFLIMLIPVFAQKLFNSDYAKWGINYHYSIEFVPIVTIALFVFLNEIIHQKKWLKVFSILILISTIYATVSSLNFRYSKWYHPILSQFYTKEHYSKEYDIAKVYKALELVPKDAIISAQNIFVPHLAMRNTIYHFPFINDAEYIVLNTLDNAYPLKDEELQNLIVEYKNNTSWEVLIEEPPVLILKRK